MEAPLLVERGTGINDDLNGIESPVSVKVKQIPEVSVEIVHSLAKWKRAKLARLQVDAGQGVNNRYENFYVLTKIFRCT